MKTKGLRQALAVTPIFLCGWLALDSRLYHDKFEVQAGSQEQNAVVYAYAPYVSDANSALEGATGEVDRHAVLTAAKEWDSAVQSGDLKPIRPVSFEDNCMEGVRGKILLTKSRLVTYLLEDADKLANANKDCDATDEVLLAVRLSESMKYGDFNDVALATCEEEREFKFLRSNLATMCPESRNDVRRELIVLSHSRARILATTQYASSQFYDFQRRFRGREEISEIRQVAMIGRRIRAEGKTPKILSSVRKNYLNDNDDATLEYLCSLRLAWRSQGDMDENVSELLAAVDCYPTAKA